LESQTVRHIPKNGHVGPQGVVLKHHRRAPPLGRKLRHLIAAEKDASLVDLDESGNTSQQRGLPTAAGTQDGRHGAALEIERGPLQRLNLPIRLADVLDSHLNHGTPQIRPNIDRYSDFMYRSKRTKSTMPGTMSMSALIEATCSSYPTLVRYM
jgi:hypothetical protein